LNTSGGTTANVTIGDAANHLNVNLGGVTRTLTLAANRTLTFMDVVSNGGITKAGSGTLYLFGVNTYTGDTTVNAGTLQIGNNTSSTLGSGNYAGNIAIASGATFRYTAIGSQNFNGIISGAGNMVINRGTVSITNNNNTYTGTTTVGVSIPNSVGTLLTVSSFNSTNPANAMLSSSLGCPTPANGTINFGNAVQVGATLKYVGPGETTDRAISINCGNSTRTLDASGSGLLKFTGPFSVSASQPKTVVLQGSGNGEIVQGIPSVVAYTLTKSGNGTWTLGGPVGNTGLLTVSGGTLALQKKSSLMGGNTANWTAALINVKSGCTLALNVDSADVDGLSSTSLDTLLTAISVASSTSAGLQSGAKLGFDTSTATGGTFTQGMILANSTGVNGGAISIIKRGTGTLVLDKANTYTGGTTIGSSTTTGDSGTVDITHSSALGTGLVSMLSNISNDRYAALTLNSAAGINVANNFSTSGEGPGTNGIIRNVTGTNTISGLISITGGGGNTRIQSDGGSLLLSGTITNGHASLSRVLILSGSATGTVSGPIRNGNTINYVALNKEGSGIWTLSGANTYTGATTIVAGTLKLGAANVLADTTPVSIGAGTLDVATYTDTVGTLDVTTNATINVGGGGAIAFADSSAIDWTDGTLKITGTFVSGSSIRFGTSEAGLTPTQLSKISIPGGRVSIDANGFLLAKLPTLILLQ